MNMRKWALVLCGGTIFALLAYGLIRSSTRAAAADCPPICTATPTRKPEKKKPTATPAYLPLAPAATLTPTATPVTPALTQTAAPAAPLVINPGLGATATNEAPFLTAQACWYSQYGKTPGPSQPTPSWGDIQVDAPGCMPTITPTPIQISNHPPVTNPMELLPWLLGMGGIVVVAGVLILLVLLGKRIF